MLINNIVSAHDIALWPYYYHYLHYYHYYYCIIIILNAELLSTTIIIIISDNEPLPITYFEHNTITSPIPSLADIGD